MTTESDFFLLFFTRRFVVSLRESAQLAKLVSSTTISNLSSQLFFILSSCRDNFFFLFFRRVQKSRGGKNRQKVKKKYLIASKYSHAEPTGYQQQFQIDSAS